MQVVAYLAHLGGKQRREIFISSSSSVVIVPLMRDQGIGNLVRHGRVEVMLFKIRDDRIEDSLALRRIHTCIAVRRLCAAGLAFCRPNAETTKRAIMKISAFFARISTPIPQ